MSTVDVEPDYGWCDQRHVSEEEVDTLQRESQDWHDAEHSGPWRFCTNPLCHAIRETVG